MREKTRQTTRRVNLRFGIYELRFKELENKKAGKRNYRFVFIPSLKNVQFPLNPYGNPEFSIPVLSCYPV
jgi:hypothetical protein